RTPIGSERVPTGRVVHLCAATRTAGIAVEVPAVVTGKSFHDVQLAGRRPRADASSPHCGPVVHARITGQPHSRFDVSEREREVGAAVYGTGRVAVGLAAIIDTTTAVGAQVKCTAGDTHLRRVVTGQLSRVHRLRN